MALTRGQVDRFGRPIPPSPGIQVVINSDGSEVQQRNRLILPDTIVASDSEDNDATVLSLTGVPAGSVALDDMAPLAAGSVIGNTTGLAATPAAVPGGATGFALLASATAAIATAILNLATNALKGLMSPAQYSGAWELIQSTTRTNQAVGNFATTTWAAGTYKRVKLVLRQVAVTGGSTIDEIQMAGLTGTYDSTLMYASSVAPGFVNSASKLIAFSSAVMRGTFDFEIPAIPELKSVQSASNNLPASPAQMWLMCGKNTDTTHEVTGLVIVTATDVVTFSFDLYGQR